MKLFFPATLIDIYIYIVQNWNSYFYIVVAAIDCFLQARSRQHRHDTEELIEGQYRYTVTMDSKNNHKLLKTIGIEIILVGKSSNIRLYCLCESLEALRELRRLFDSGQLKIVIEEFFNSLLVNIQSKRVNTHTTVTTAVHLTHLSLVDYCLSEECFNNGLYDYKNLHFLILRYF